MRLVKRLERVAVRTNATILVAACIIGLAMVIPFYHPKDGRYGSASRSGLRQWQLLLAPLEPCGVCANE
jgi:hypothetical protein